MSFIQDPKTYKNIISVLKTAQQTRPINTTSVLKKLSDNLSRELEGGAPVDNITSTSDIGLTIDHLYNLSSLLTFLSQNKIKLNDKQIVYTKNEYGTVSDPSILTQLNDFYVDIPSLTKYMSHLQNMAKKNKNHLLETSLSTLIDQIKEVHPKFELSKTKEKSTPESPNVIAGTTVVDRFQRKVFDPKNPMANTGNDHLLFASNLASAGALNAWLRDAGQATVIMYDNNQAKSVSFFDEHANRCIVPQVLYKRASYLYNTGDDEQRRVASFYMKRVQEIVGEFTGPDEKACTLEFAAVTSPTQPADKTEASTVDYDTVIKAAPLRMRDLSFGRIKDFFDKYQNFLGGQSRPGVKISINNALEAMKQIQTSGNFLKNPGMEVFNLNAGPEEIKALLLPPEGKRYIAFLDRLQTIIVNVGYVLRDLMTVYGERSDSNKEFQNVLAQQIGYGSGSGSIYGNNLNQIQRMKSFARNA